MRSSLGRAEPIRALKVQNKGADGPRTGSYGAMAARWIPDPKVGGSNPSSFMPFFGRFGPLFKKNALPKLGIAPRLPRPQRGVLLLDYFGGWRQMEDPGIDPGSQPCEGCMLPCTTIPQTNCVHRDSNPNLILGRDKYYPCTMDARIV